MNRLLALASLAACASFAPAQLFNRVEIKTTNPNWFYQEFIPSSIIRTSLVTSGNGTYNPGTSLDFTGKDAVYQVWWFYRGTNDPREYGLTFLDTGTNAGNRSSYQFTEPSEGGGNVFEFKFDYTLVSVSATEAYLRIDWHVRNRTASERTCNFYSFNDLQIGSNSAANTGTVNGRAITFQSLLTSSTVTLTTAGTAPTHRELGLYSGIRNRLMDGAKTTLADTFDPDSKDIAAALQYNLSLPANGLASGTIFRGYNMVPAMVASQVIMDDLATTPDGLPVRIQLTNPGTNVVVETMDAIVDNGQLEIVTGKRGVYDIVVKSKTTLSSRAQSVNITNDGVSGAVFHLASGDLDGDNSVTVFDYDKLSTYFDASSSDANWTTPDADGVSPQDADIDNDGAVTVFDYDILSRNFDRSGD